MSLEKDLPSEMSRCAVLLQGRPDVLADLVTHLMAEHNVHRPLQPIMALLRHQRVEALCALCCEMAAESHVAQVATLLAEAARYNQYLNSWAQLLLPRLMAPLRLSCLFAC